MMGDIFEIGLAKTQGLVSRVWTLLNSWRLAEVGSESRLVPFSNFTNAKYITLGQKTIIGKGARLDCIRKYGIHAHSGQILIGDMVTINPHVHIAAASSVVIGNNVLIASRVYISDHDHGYSKGVPPAHMPLLVESIKIGNNVWIGEGVMILKGVTVGDGAVIGAASVVTKDVPPYSVVVGVPARILRYY